MKTTVKAYRASVVVRPGPATDHIELTVIGEGGAQCGTVLTVDQAGALLFGMEQALEVIEQRHRQALATMHSEARGVRCHGDACHMGQSPCPSPKACGVGA